MNTNTYGAIEAILFASGEALTLQAISDALELEKADTAQILDEMISFYDEDRHRGIHIVRIEDKYQLASKSEFYPELIRLINNPKEHVLTDVLLETLSIIAYKQPITRQQIETIRGVSCSHVINKLIDYKLIKEIGRLDAPGRPILFGTTDDFLRCFGIASMDELPEISADLIQDFKKQAEEEAGITVET